MPLSAFVRPLGPVEVVIIVVGAFLWPCLCCSPWSYCRVYPDQEGEWHYWCCRPEGQQCPWVSSSHHPSSYPLTPHRTQRVLSGCAHPVHMRGKLGPDQPSPRVRSVLSSKL